MIPASTATGSLGATKATCDGSTPVHRHCDRQEGRCNEQGRATCPAHEQALAVLQHGRGNHYKGV